MPGKAPSKPSPVKRQPPVRLERILVDFDELEYPVVRHLVDFSETERAAMLARLVQRMREAGSLHRHAKKTRSLEWIFGRRETT